MTRLDFEEAREAMVATQLVARGIRDPRVLAALKKIPRHEFIPDAYRAQAYEDDPLPIGDGQTISQPYMVAFMTEALELKPSDRVLEIGTGSGYQTAALAELAGEVYTVERLEPLMAAAKIRFGKLGYEQVFPKLGDGSLGWPEAAPFDKIVMTAAAESLPKALVDQLKDEGRLVYPIGAQHETQQLVVSVKQKGILKTLQTMPVRFVPLVSEPEATRKGKYDAKEENKG